MNNNLRNNMYRIVCNNNLVVNKSRINYIIKKVEVDGLYICKLNCFEIEALSARNYMCVATRNGKYIIESFEV